MILRLKNLKLSRLRFILIKFFYFCSWQFRKRRFKLFNQLVNKIKKPVKILDVGGTELFWWQMGYWNNKNYKITLLNLKRQLTSAHNIKSVIGDGVKLQFKNKSFDLAFSNSTIEHVGNYNRQKRFAKETQRVGIKFYVQTPNKYFPIEPHFALPFFYLIPEKYKLFVVDNFSFKWRKTIKNHKLLQEIISSIRLLTEKEIKALFPKANIHKEKILFFTKSFLIFN